MTYAFTIGSLTVKARVGQYICCNIMGHFLRVEDSITNGLGIKYRVRQGGELVRVNF